MRKVYLFGEINNERAEKFIAQLHDLFEEGGEPITVFINSCGGSVTDALAIYDVLQNAPCEFYTVGLGKVHSSAITVLLSAPRTNRASYPNTEFMSHDISWKSDGPREFLRSRVEQLDRTVDQLLIVYTRDTNLSVEEARKLFFTGEGDRYFNADDAQAMGFVSRIVVGEKDYKARPNLSDTRYIESISANQNEEFEVINSSKNS